MIVRMLTQECGPNGSFGIGELRTVSEEHGYMLVDTKHAELVALGKPEQAIAPVAEVTEASAAEVTAPRKPARR